MSTLQLRIFDGTCQPFRAPAKFLVTIIDGNQAKLVSQFYDKPSLNFELPFYDNFGDNYSVIVWAQGYRQAGFQPVKLSNAAPVTLNIMLVADNPGFSFVSAQWPQVSPQFPFLGGDVAPASAQTRYQNLMDQHPPVIACFLNLVEAMGQIAFSDGTTPLSYIKQMRWSEAPQQDRFFAYCDAALVNQVRAAAAKGQFAVEPNPGLFHPGSTNSWKQIQFGEANVQLTFHENPPDTATINGVHCVTVEPDIDYYRDLGAHAIFEVAENALTHSLTDPVQVYVLRWIAGQRANIPQFAPLYTLTDDQPAAINAKLATPLPSPATPNLKTR